MLIFSGITLKFPVLILLLLYSLSAYAQMEDETRLERFVNNFYSKPGHVQNQVLVSSEFGLSQLNSYNFTSATDLAGTKNLEFYYGFIRIDPETGNPGIFKHQSEFAFVGNISTDFKTFKSDNIGIPTDAWRFGFGLNDGFGFLNDDKPTLFLNHSTAMSFLRADFDGISQNENDTKYLNEFDRKFRFGQVYSGGIRYKLYSVIHLNAQYEMSQYYADFEFMPWFGMWLTDNVLQRWIDYFEPDLISVLGRNYPWVKFVYKNFVSLLSYQIRKHEMYFPFKSEAPLYYDSFKIGITLII